MENEYDLETLIEIFESHYKEYEESEHKRPDINSFNLPRALFMICKEIKALKDRNS
jgi:hypothetical protein